MKPAFFYSIIGFAFIVFLSSYTEDQNFNQFNELEIVPNVATSLFYFESSEAVINLAGTATFYSSVFTFEAFEEKFVADNILDGVIQYEIDNTTSKEIDVLIEFLDASGNSLDNEFFRVVTGPSNILLEVAYGTATGKTLDILRNTTNIRVTATNLSDIISTSSQNEPKIILRSNAEFRLRLL